MTKEEIEDASAELFRKAEKHLEENLGLYESYSMDVKVNLCRILLDFTWKNINGFNDILRNINWESLINVIDVLSENGVCSSCKNNPPNKPHICPYKDEINNNQDLCDCCSKCRGDCAQDI